MLVRLALIILALFVVSAGPAAAEDDDFRNGYCEFLDTFDPEQFEAYVPCSW